MSEATIPEVGSMVRKEACTACKGNKVVCVTTSRGDHKCTPCPQCGGNGYLVRVELDRR